MADYLLIIRIREKQENIKDINRVSRVKDIIDSVHLSISIAGSATAVSPDYGFGIIRNISFMDSVKFSLPLDSAILNVAGRPIMKYKKRMYTNKPELSISRDWQNPTELTMFDIEEKY